MSDLFEKASDFFAGTVKDVKGTLNYVADDLQRSQVVMSMYMREYFKREAEQATRLLQLYEKTMFNLRFEREVTQTV